MSQITIKDLAKKLGLSTSTISRALRDHPDINSETKKLIVDTADKMGYEPNIIARNLKSKYTNQIGVIVPEIKHDFFANVISGIEDVAYNKGFTVIVSQSNEDEKREKINANALYMNRVSGLIVSLSETTKSLDHFESLLQKDTHIVFFDRVSDKLDTYQVVLDDFKGGYDSVKYLVSKGYKRIAHLAGPVHLQNCKDRLRGYKKALEDSGVIVDEDLIVYGGMHEDNGKAGIQELVNKGIKFDAVFAVNDPVAVGALLYLKEKGVKIPEEVAIIGFSNNPVTEYLSPKLTTVELYPYEMGKQSALLLISLIKGENNMAEKKIVLPTKLIIRESA